MVSRLYCLGASSACVCSTILNKSIFLYPAYVFVLLLYRDRPTYTPYCLDSPWISPNIHHTTHDWRQIFKNHAIVMVSA